MADTPTIRYAALLAAIRDEYEAAQQAGRGRLDSDEWLNEDTEAGWARMLPLLDALALLPPEAP